MMRPSCCYDVDADEEEEKQQQDDGWAGVSQQRFAQSANERMVFEFNNDNMKILLL